MPVRFLIADDIPAHQQLLANAVMMLGGESRFAANGKEALRLAENEAFDIVLLDLQMPELGGVAAADHLITKWRSLSFRPRIVAVSGEGGEDARALCRAVGMDGYIAKPFPMATLRPMLKQLIMQGHCWDDGPPERLLDVICLGAKLSQDGAQFEASATEARSRLRELADKLEVLPPEECVSKAEAVGAFARQHGLVKLAPVMDTLAKAARDGEASLFSGQLADQLRDFERCVVAAREWLRHAPASARAAA